MIRTELMPHQDTIVDFAFDKDGTAVFSDYGTGKTLCALVVANKHIMRRVLVVSTKLSIKSTWIDEILQHTNFKYVILTGTPKHKSQQIHYGLALSQRVIGNYWEEPENTVIFLVNYDGVKNIFHQLIQINWDLVVADESTKIKSPDTTRTKILWALSKYIKKKMIMTGFPVTERFSELYAQIKFLGHGEVLGSSYHSFINRFFVKTGGGLIPKKNAVKEIVQLIKPFTIRVTNKTLKLPPKIYKVIKIPLTKQQKMLLDELTETYQLEFGSVKIDTQHIFTLVTKSLQICNGFITDNEKNMASFVTGKDEALLEMLDEIDVRQNKVVIWCAFLPSIARLEKLLRQFRIPTLTLTGATKNENAVVRQFQASKKSNVLFATQKKAAESITLTSARYAIYYSNVWSYDLRGNSEARIRRKGSHIHDSIMYIDLLTDDITERKVYECLRKKKNLIVELKKAFEELKGDSSQ